MRPLLIILGLLFSSQLQAASCSEVAKSFAQTDSAELAAVLTSLNQSGQLPAKFVGKKEATAQGWKPGSDLWQVLPGKSIGGDRFGNYEKALPKDQYKEADLDYKGGKRGAKRIVFSRSQRFITMDHYRTFREVPACQ